ncbi:MAG: peptidase T [Firmicutes bacterium]|nr:peptidase T [Bacillota bacterium]
MNYQEKLAEKFFRYAAISSQSVGGSPVVPSSPGQTELAKLLMKELEEVGAVDISISDTAVVIGHIPANLPEGHAPVPAVGWVAHLDTVDSKVSPDIHPVMIRNYQGGDICQNEALGLYIKADEHPELAKYIGQDIIVSDGTSVLGADNKSAIANVMTAMEILHNDPSIPHGEIYCCFVPDEEVGLCGAKSIDFSKFPVAFAYTIDCCELGEVVFQTFNAGSGRVHIKGRTAHPMNSKNNVINPCMIATDIINMFDRAATPEHTEDTEGYIWVTGIRCDALNGEVDLNIRDHSKAKYEAKKEYIKAAVEMAKLKHPEAQISVELTDVYANIYDAVNENNSKCIDYIYEAMKQLDITPKTIAMRGGTDGSFISGKGILTPNYFTGAHNFHAISEFMPMEATEKSLLMTLKLIELITEGK